MGDKTTIRDVFNQSQTGLQGHGKLIKTLGKIYEKTEFPVFWSEFSHCLKHALIIFKREPAVERVIDFVAKFAPSLSKRGSDKDVDGEGADDDQEDSVADNKLLQEMFDFLLSCHRATDRAVRFRCCQLVNKLLTNLGEDAQIDDELYDRLYETMLDRLKDKCPVVRYHAVLAMSRLQDPTDENCPVIRAYIFLLNCDPNHDVRRGVLTSIAPSTKTLASIIGRTRDVRDVVRMTAYVVISEKIHIKALSIALRLQIVHDGLKDRSEIVKQACAGKLLQAWMRTFNGSYLDLLKSLDVEDSTEICTMVLKTLFEASSVTDILERFDILNESLLVPENRLTSESALFWQVVCDYFHKMGTEGDEHLEKVLPSVVEFCGYLQRYVDDLKTVEDPEIQLGREFIIEQLLQITSLMDTADASSRKALESLLHNMLMADHVSHRLVKPIVARICALRGTAEAMIAYFAEIVSEIREPITVVEKDIEAEKQRQINLKMAGIRVQLNQLRDNLEVAVRDQDFTRAAEIKASIAHLDAEKNVLLVSQEPVREEIRAERNDPLTILKCQTIISEMLQLLKLNTVSPTLQMMIETQIVPGIQNEDAEVRNTAMQALGLCCYLSKDLLVTYIPLFMQASQIDVEGVRVTALQILFDLLLIFGLDIVDASETSSTGSENGPQTSEQDASSMEKASDERNGTASKLVAIICSFLDGEVVELRTCAAEGLSKLLLSGRVVSSKILSHLILLWYNPLSEDETHLRVCLGTFFPLYALASRSNQEVVEEAFLPTLKTLLNAPPTSPLAEVDVNNVAELLVQLTNTKLLTVNQAKENLSQSCWDDNPGHDNLSERVCNEILSAPESAHVKLWSRILNQMEISPDNEVVIKDLRILAYKMVKTVKERISLKALQKFQATISKLASKYVTNDDDLPSINLELDGQAGEVVDTADTTMDQSDARATPKRKRVRGLYSANMTLGVTGMDSELDITGEDSLEDVDASCLMSAVPAPSSTSTTPVRKGRSKKTAATTELAADEDVFAMPEVPATKKACTEITSPDSEVAESEAVTREEINKEAEKGLSEDESPKRGRSSEKAGRTSLQKSPAGSGKKNVSSRKDSEKRKASRSPVDSSPEKRIASESPARRNQEKRKASKSPATERKRMSKSPDYKANEKKIGPQKNPEKKTVGKPPIKEAAKGDQSPSKRKSSASLTSPSASKAGDKAKQKVTAKEVGPSKARVDAKTDKNTRKPSTVTLIPEKNVRTAANRNASNKTTDSPDMTRAKSVRVSVMMSEKTKADATLAAENSPRNAGKQGKQKDVGAEKVRVSVSMSEKTKADATLAAKNSPRKQKDAGSKTADVAKSGRSLVKLVVDTPEKTEEKRRTSTRSVADTPEISSPMRATQSVVEESVAETPEHAPGKVCKKAPESRLSLNTRRAGSGSSTPNSTPKSSTASGARSTKTLTPSLDTSRNTRSSQKSVLTPTPAGSSSRPANKVQAKAFSQTENTKKPVKRGITSSASSQSDSSPEKRVAKATRVAAKKAASSEDASLKSPNNRQKATTKSAPMERKTSPTKPSSQTDDDEEETIVRKARPSRRSANVSGSASVPISPPASAARVTRAFLSQSSTQSPRSPGRGGVMVQGSSSQSQETQATRRSVRGSGDMGSPVSSSLSLISTLPSQSTGSQSTATQSSTASRASRKPAATQSESMSPASSTRSSKVTEVTKGSRSTVQNKTTLTRNSKLKRPSKK
ncbi:condensin complex subunit 3-like isoform X1 [Dreissena polymorpha]|uniref:condensin complex subunit 3-like isoform X1 n=1 Tax=Dreissena polymorpha TaxID=45954 RepID=UPI0022652579|nr:condensin complex subunit 3-like isoform X1 [Dreissena polymorpha]XP_052249368.1 condensin complex subunit 3-like isoform X1 [Dreissena polymorpha]